MVPCPEGFITGIAMYLKALQNLRPAPPRICRTGLGTLDSGGQGHLGECSEKGNQDGIWAEVGQLRGKAPGAEHDYSGGEEASG